MPRFAGHLHTHAVGSLGGFCMVTMADHFARRKYSISLRSQVCYARRHGYVIGVAAIKPFDPSEIPPQKKGSLPITYRKHDIIERYSRDKRCKWLACESSTNPVNRAQPARSGTQSLFTARDLD